MPCHLPWMTVRMSQSTAMEKSKCDRMHPCLPPVSTLIVSVTWLLCKTRHSMLSYKARMMFTNFCGIPWWSRIFQSDGRCMLSKAFSTSTNTTYKELFHSCDFSRIWRRTKMWSMHDFSFTKPACSWCSSLSTTVVMRWRMMRQKSLLVMDSSVMPLQLLLSGRFPFFGSLMIVPLFQALGIIVFIVPDVLEDVLKKLLSAYLHAHCRPLVLYRSSASWLHLWPPGRWWSNWCPD